MAKQHVIQLLPLPRELISVVKEYTFYHKDYVLARRRRSRILDIIKHTCYKSDDDPIKFIFWSGIRKDHQFQSDFCTTCGNYTIVHGILNPVAECSCVTG